MDNQGLKKNYDKGMKEVELLKAQTLTYKRSYTSKNPNQTQNHFIKLHNAQKNWELARFDYFHHLNNTLSQGNIFLLDQFVSLVYSKMVRTT